MRIIFGVLVFTDGFLSAIFGHGLLHILGKVKGPPIYHAVLDHFLGWDERLFRIGAACQAAAGLFILFSSSKSGQTAGSVRFKV